MKKSMYVLLTLSLLIVLASALLADSKDATVAGWVTDTMCAAKGASNTHADCVKKCVKGGAKVALVADSDQKVYTVENPDALSGHEGHHVEVKGHVDGDKIHVESAKMLDQKGAAKDDDMHK
jgi:hypothetical protein